MSGILRTIARVANRHDRRPPGFRERPERIVLGVADGLVRSAQPPVRVFVGTEPGQHRAERVFIWSVEQARDRARVYEIYLMADLRGFDRRRWLTGFTNYRFAIPHLAGGAGRAIYNDVDQIYLADPAELFDMDMGCCGFLSITARDTSVMLIDCARMGGVWTLDGAQRLRRKRIEANTRAAGSFWGPLGPEWNARDEEYVAGRSKLLHYTTIHTQPWQPFPERFVYQRSPVDHVWLRMERAADAAHYRIFNAHQPSAQYRELMAQRRGRRHTNGRAIPPAPGTGPGDAVEELLAEVRPASVLEYRLHSTPTTAIADREGRTATRFDPALTSPAALPERAFDAVICSSTLEYLPEADIPWVIEWLFGRARRCVCLSVGANPESARGIDQSHPGSWWLTHIETASARYPDVHWKLVLADRRSGERSSGRPLVREGGRRADGKVPTVWVLKDQKAGHTTQSIGLADAVGFPYDTKELRFNLLNHFSNRIRGASTLGLDTRRSAPLGPPWPDLVISTGRRTAPVARWIGRQNRGRTRLVQLGRRGGETVGPFDLVVACAHFRRPLHPRRMEITAPLNAVSPAQLARAAARWSGLFDGAPRPHIVLVVGGSCARHRLDADTANRLGAEARAFTESVGGSLFAITSPRTGAQATAALRAGLGASAHLHEWRPDADENPYMGYLALADALVVTGESESMLAEAAAAAKPLFIYPLPERPLGFRWPAEWIARRAEARPRKAKGTVRPQQGLEYLCARLIEGGLVRPPRHLDQLHEGLVRLGVARYFGTSFDPGAHRQLRDIDDVARRVRLLLGFTDPPSAESLSPPAPEIVELAPAVSKLRRDAVSLSGVGDGIGRRSGAAQP